MFDPSPRKFALLVTGVLNPQFTSRYGTITLIFERFLKEAGEVWDSFLVVNGDFSFMDGIDDYSGFVVTGSQFDAHANDPWILQLCQALKHLHHMKKKILGWLAKAKARPERPKPRLGPSWAKEAQARPKLSQARPEFFQAEL
ncbi:hypothetical protein AMTR_s00025p00236620 [Amborella trichopoda]|uniref:Glutamine amidotransferase domain-containing protein n=1 Tax=Amborella trichopoda TaxID=13333 RepID=W1PWT3_AMBTC|nr:hypothetical protein AMTR_s00025p00236620 [Amborella trichopoda]